MKLTLSVLLACLVHTAFAADPCPSSSIEEWKKQMSDPFFGLLLSLDLTHQFSCVSESGPCELVKYEEPPSVGYYEAHTVFFISKNGHVIFASTSEFTDSTYGNTHGSPTAEKEWKDAYADLISRGVCRR
jgi:hypothetical protein